MGAEERRLSEITQNLVPRKTYNHALVYHLRESVFHLWLTPPHLTQSTHFGAECQILSGFVHRKKSSRDEKPHPQSP
jgi:hypothetical protein